MRHMCCEILHNIDRALTHSNEFGQNIYLEEKKNNKKLVVPVE